MFGLTPEKILVLAVLAAFILGPQKLPLYASKLAALVKQVRAFISTSQERIKEEIGPDADDIDWKKLDPRQFDPRRIIKEALLEPDAPVRVTAPAHPTPPVAEQQAPSTPSPAS